jgi:low affinity Fe/Cu permease
MTKKKEDFFTRFTTKASTLLGRPLLFISALIILLLWGISGPLLGFSDTWQLVINTSTTIITFLMVFIIQNTQNRDSLAINIKLDAIMKKHGISDKDLMEAEEESDKKLEQQKKGIQNDAEHKRPTRKRKK